MAKATVPLLALVAILLLWLIAHLWYQPERQRDMYEAVTAQNRLLEQIDGSLREIARSASGGDQTELRAIREQLTALSRRIEAGVRVDPGQDGGGIDPADPAEGQPEAADDPRRDGVAKEGGNFLLPYDRSDFDASKVGGVLRLLRGGATPPGLNDIIHNAAITSDINGLVNDSLCGRDPVEIELWRANLATSCVIEDGYKTFTFTIRPGIYWQVPTIAREDGFAWLREPVELTAADFAFYVEMVNHPDVQCPSLKAYYADIEAVEALDDHTLQVRWKEANYTNISFSMGMSPIPRHVYTRDESGQPIPEADLGLRFNKHWFDEAYQLIGVGAYQLDEFVFDQRIRFRRNPGYWGAGEHFDAQVWDFTIKDDAPQLVAFKNGQAHSHGLTATQFKTQVIDHAEKRFAAFDPDDPKAGREGELGWEKIIGNGYSYIGWNNRRPPFDDKRVRQAMSYAFPKQRIIDEVYYSLGRPQVANVHPDSQYANHELEAYPFDPGRARELLAEAGWEDSDGDSLLDRDGAPFSFTIKYYANSPEWDNTLAIYRNELRGLGIEMELLTQEWPKMIEAYQNQDFDAVSGGWRMGLDVDFMQLWHSKEADTLRSSNHCGFKDPRADELAERLRKTFDLEERIAIAREFQAIVHEEQPYTFFRSSEGVFAWQNKAGGRDPKGLVLEGVIQALDRNHTFTKTSHDTWYFPVP